MPEVVDPSPIIEQRLQVLAAEYGPAIRALEDALVVADPDEKARLKTELRRARRAYASARREAEKLSGPTIMW